MKSSLSFCAVLILFAGAACSAAEAPPAKHAEPAAQGAPADKKKAPPELSPLEVVTTLRGNETDIRRCFFANPGARGFVRFSWNVDTEGLVSGVKSELSTIGDRRVVGCLAERLSELKFGLHTGGLASPSSARWAFVFQIVENPEADSDRDKKKNKKKKKKPHIDDEPGVSIDPSSQGSLPLEAVDRVVEAGYPLFARCYRDGVSRNNDISGSLRLRFVVGENGRVESLADAGSDLSDRQAVDCVAEAFFSLRFPEPKNGSVQVTYRIHFAGSGR